MSNDSNNLESFKQFRLLTVKITLLVTFTLAAIAWFFDPLTTQGVLLGGLAGILGFWIIAIRLEKVARMKPNKVQFAALTWSAYRFALYGAVLYKTFTLDRETYHGLIGGLIGIMAIRFVLVIVGATGLGQNTANTSQSDEEIESSEGSDHSNS